MHVIVCVADNGGILFNHRRVSRDAVLIQDVLDMTWGRDLWTDEYSALLFPEGTVRTDPEFRKKAKAGDYTFCERAFPEEEKVEGIIIYRWNRDYPADVFLPYGLDCYELESSREFAGKSHQKITREIWKKEPFSENRGLSRSESL